RAAPVLRLADDLHGLTALPAEVRGAFELARLAGLPGTVLAPWCGDRVADAPHTRRAEHAAVLDRDHQGDDQERADKDASHASLIGIRGICLKSSVSLAAELVVRAEEVLGAGGRHRRARRDLEGERGSGHDLREAIDLPSPRAAHQLEPGARVRKDRAPADRADLEPRQPDCAIDAVVDP